MLAVCACLVAVIVILVPFDRRHALEGVGSAFIALGLALLVLADAAARLRRPQRQAGPLIARRAPALSFASILGWLLVDLALLLQALNSPGFHRNPLLVALSIAIPGLIVLSIPLSIALRMARHGLREIQFSITETGVSSLVLLTSDISELTWSSIESLERIENGIMNSPAPVTAWRLNFRRYPAQEQPFAQATLGRLDLTRGGGCTQTDILRAIALYRPQLIDEITLR